MNRPILQMMLEGLLAFIMTKPGISYEALIEKYSPILQPVPLMELVEVSSLFNIYNNHGIE